MFKLISCYPSDSCCSVTYDELRTRYLQFSVYDFDRFSRHDLIGQVVLKGLLDCTDLLQEIEYTMNVLCAPQVCPLPSLSNYCTVHVTGL